MDKRWLIAPAEPALQQTLARELSLPAPVAQVLINRGYRDVAAARAFLHPQLRHLRDPFELPDMEAAVERIRAGGRIVIYGDYDVDGVTGTAILLQLLIQLGADVEFHVPLRLSEGYGLSSDKLRRPHGFRAEVLPVPDEWDCFRSRLRPGVVG